MNDDSELAEPAVAAFEEHEAGEEVADLDSCSDSDAEETIVSESQEDVVGVVMMMMVGG